MIVPYLKYSTTALIIYTSATALLLLDLFVVLRIQNHAGVRLFPSVELQSLDQKMLVGLLDLCSGFGASSENVEILPFFQFFQDSLSSLAHLRFEVAFVAENDYGDRGV